MMSMFYLGLILGIIAGVLLGLLLAGQRRVRKAASHDVRNARWGG
jgi:ABC-type nitrate/sulfonate/bicarbonate transport system permease component